MNRELKNRLARRMKTLGRAAEEQLDAFLAGTGEQPHESFTLELMEWAYLQGQADYSLMGAVEVPRAEKAWRKVALGLPK